MSVRNPRVMPLGFFAHFQKIRSERPVGTACTQSRQRAFVSGSTSTRRRRPEPGWMPLAMRRLLRAVTLRP